MFNEFPEWLPAQEVSEGVRKDSRPMHFLAVLSVIVFIYVIIFGILYLLPAFKNSLSRPYVMGVCVGLSSFLLVRELLILFAPFPVISIDKSQVAPGGYVTIFWSMKKPTTQIRRL